MAGRAGRVGLLIATLLLALPLPAWAGSSQAALAVTVVVSPRCAVRMPASLISSEVSAIPPSHESVAMRCTKGALPSGAASARAATTVGPRITRDLVLTAATGAMAAPRPLTETISSAGAEVAAPRMVITVNF